jgi:predicted DNA-binding protein with PD1-like motif
MRHKQLNENSGLKSYAVVLETGEEVMSCLQEFILVERISAAQITAIGAFSDLVLMYFDWEKKDYLRIPVREQVEVAALIGDVAEDPSGKPSPHIHLVMGKRSGAALAGHLAEGHVRRTLEVVVTESPVHLHKVKDKERFVAFWPPGVSHGVEYRAMRHKLATPSYSTQPRNLYVSDNACADISDDAKRRVASVLTLIVSRGCLARKDAGAEQSLRSVILRCEDGERTSHNDISSIIDALFASSTSGSVPRTRSYRRSPRTHHSLSTRSGSHVRIHRTYNANRLSLRQP